jgi:hypothetical protein
MTLVSMTALKNVLKNARNMRIYNKLVQLIEEKQSFMELDEKLN